MLSQVAQTDRLGGQVAYANRHDSNPSFLCRPVRLYQIGAADSEDQAQSFCLEVQAFPHRAPIGVLHFMHPHARTGLRVQMVTVSSAARARGLRQRLGTKLLRLDGRLG
jgi:hypothetical protein